MVKVENEPDLARDECGVIHNVNEDAYRAYIAKRAAFMENRNRIEKLESDVSNINDKLNKIIMMLSDDGK